MIWYSWCFLSTCLLQIASSGGHDDFIDSLRFWGIKFLTFLILQNLFSVSVLGKPLIQTRISRFPLCSQSTFSTISSEKEKQFSFQNAKMRLRWGCKNQITISFWCFWDPISLIVSQLRHTTFQVTMNH